jgi:hypothetical protein
MVLSGPKDLNGKWRQYLPLRFFFPVKTTETQNDKFRFFQNLGEFGRAQQKRQAPPSLAPAHKKGPAPDAGPPAVDYAEFPAAFISAQAHGKSANA